MKSYQLKRCQCICRSFSSFQEQLWKLDDTALISRSKLWKSKDKWNFKTNECIWYIKLAKKDKVLGITNENEVIDDTIVPDDMKQMWIIGPTNNKGYFTLNNLHSQQLLTANSSDEFEITGMSYRNNISNQLSFHFSFFSITLDRILIDKGNHDGTSPLHLSAKNLDSLSTR